MAYVLHHGDCLEIMPTLEANSVDTIVTDPPYGLSFMGKEWDHGVPGVAFWREALRVAKPGAMLLAFGGTRTFHRLTCAIEDAGWEVRDVLTWLYGSGFPKSHDISKAIDKAAGAERTELVHYDRYRDGVDRTPQDNGKSIFDGRNGNYTTAPATDNARTWHGWGTALKPAWEPVILAMKPLDGTFAENALAWGVAGLAIDKGRIEADAPIAAHHGTNGAAGRTLGNRNEYVLGDSGTIFQTAGRWPANLLLDEDAARALDAASGERKGATSNSHKTGGAQNCYGKYSETPTLPGYGDTGGASRFFYVAKASRTERNAGLEEMEARYQLRSDLTPEQQAYVMSELQRLGIA